MHMLRKNCHISGRGPDSSVGIAPRHGLDGPVIVSPWGARFSELVQTGRGAHPASYTIGTAAFQGGEQPRRDADNPPHLAPRLKKEYSFTSTPSPVLLGLFYAKIYLTFLSSHINVYTAIF